jgi:membrane protein implicated in regulation of membrane protease activity
MEIPGSTFWWVAAGIAVAAELGTGTLYLLMIALGLAAGAVAAHLGAGGSAQVATVAAVGAAATVVWHWRRTRRGAEPMPAPVNRDVNLDIGERVHVDAWAPDRTARVHYRGTGWSARLVPGATPRAGEHRVAAVEGNWLVLAPASPVD